MKRLLFLLLLWPLLTRAADQSPYAIILSDQSDITRTITEKDFFTVISLQNTSDSLILLRDIELSSFIETSTGVRAQPDWQFNGRPLSPTFQIGSGKTVRMELRCSLPETGTYQGLLSMEIVSKGNRKELFSRDFMVTYAKPAKTPEGKKKPFFQVKDLSTLNGVLGELLVQMNIEDTSGKGGTITQILPRIRLLGPNNETRSTDPGKIVVRNARDSSEIGKALKFDDARPSYELQLDLSGIRKPGSYKGEVFISSPDAQPVTSSFTFTVKETWPVALVWIVLGLLVSLLVRWLMTVIQPRLKNKQKVGLLLRQAKAFEDLQPEENSVLADYIGQLNELFNLLDTETPDDLAARLSLLKLKERVFREWVQARRQVHALRPMSLQETLLPELRKAEEFIRRHDGEVETGNELLPPLRNMEASIRKLVGEHIFDQSSKLLEAAEKELAAAGATEKEIGGIREQVAALALLPVNTNAELDALKAAFSRLQDEYGKLLVSEIKEQMEKLMNGPRPPETTAAEWLQVLDPVRKAIQEAEKANALETRVSAIKEANRLLLKGLHERLDVYRDRMAAKQASDPDITDEMIRSAEAARTAASDLLNGWAGMELDQALEEFGKVMDMAAALWAPQPDSRPARGTESLPLPSDFTFREGDEAGRTTAFRFLRRSFMPADTRFSMDKTDLGEIRKVRGTLRKLAWQVFLAELVSSLVVLVISAGLGLLLLWAPNDTWGSVVDIIYAAFWGFGLHTVSKASDITGNVSQFVRGKITGPGS